MTVTRPKGFRASGVAAGLKASGDPDVALVVNDGPDSTAAGVFTGNRVKAAPVLWSQQVLKGGIVRAVVLNSGGANACTGTQGFRDTHATAEHTAAVLRGGAKPMLIGAGDVAVCSTGLIGELLPMDKLLPGVDAAAKELTADGGAGAAEAIMTTDTVAKNAVVARRRLVGRRHGQGRRHARARAGHHAGRAHHRRGGRQRGAGRGAARGDPADLRPDRRGRLHVHQRHRAAAGQRRLRRRSRRRRS